MWRVGTARNESAQCVDVQLGEPVVLDDQHRQVAGGTESTVAAELLDAVSLQIEASHDRRQRGGDSLEVAPTAVDCLAVVEAVTLGGADDGATEVGRCLGGALAAR